MSLRLLGCGRHAEEWGDWWHERTRSSKVTFMELAWNATVHQLWREMHLGFHDNWPSQPKRLCRFSFVLSVTVVVTFTALLWQHSGHFLPDKGSPVFAINGGFVWIDSFFFFVESWFIKLWFEVDGFGCTDANWYRKLNFFLSLVCLVIFWEM